MSAVIPDLGVPRLHPLRDNVLVRCRLTETTAIAGVMIPDTVRKPLDLGSVVAVGPGRRAQDGTLIPPGVVPGDEVALEHNQGTEVTLAGEKLLLLSERDILGVLIVPPHGERPLPAGEIAEPIPEQETQWSRAAREESLETDVAPALLDREPPTGEDLH